MVAKVFAHNRIHLFTAAFCKLFSHASIPIHALLASLRRPIGFLKTPFSNVTNALLKSN